MKRYYVLLLLTATAIVFSYCSGSKKGTASSTKAAPKMLVYETDVHALVAANCAPCHIPEKGGRKKAYDNYANVKADIDDIIRRMELNPTDRGFMPFKATAKLSDSTINVFKQWKADGMLEK